MSKFHDRLKGLHADSGMTQVELANRLGISPQAMSYIINGREPKYDLLLNIARCFNVSIDYLLGLSEYKIPENAEINNTTGLTDSSLQTLKEINEFYNRLTEKATKPNKKKFYSQFIPTLNRLVCAKNFKRFIAVISYYIVPALREDDVRRIKTYQDVDNEPYYDDVREYYKYIRNNVHDELNELLDELAEDGDTHANDTP